MTRNAFLTILFASSLLVAAHAQTTTFKTSGAFASSNFQNGPMIFVGSGDVGGGAQPFLEYSTFTFNADGSFSASFGFGNIPSSAFVANNVQQMSLNVDTSQVPGFQASTCTQTVSSYTCTTGPLGVIQISWQQNGYSSSTTRQTLDGTSANVTMNVTFDNSYASANASGTFLGTAVTDTQSEIGTDKNRQITITMGKS